eukprot:3743813-Prymnesium_polylepis.1
MSGTSVDDAIAAAVLDDQGILAAAAAEALCQDEGSMPQLLSALLRPARSAAALGLYGVVFDSHGQRLGFEPSGARARSAIVHGRPRSAPRSAR